MSTMGMAAWDRELENLVGEVDDVMAQKKVSTRGGSLVARKVKVVQSGMRLSRILKRIGQMMSREHLLLPRERAFLVWGNTYLDAVKKRTEAERDVLNKNLWLRLVRTRIIGGASRGDVEARDEASFLDGDELVSLTVRHANLGKTERYLQGALRDLTVEQQKLVAAYHELAVEKANREAARSLGARLGETVEEALGGLGQAALGGYLRGLFVLAAGGDALGSFVRLEERYAEKAKNLVVTCRNLVLGDKVNGPSRPKDRAMSRMAAALRQLDDLEKDLQSAYIHHLGPLGAPAPALKTGPNLVQTGQKNAKT